MESEAREFINKYEERVISLSNEAGLAYFNASISGNEEDYNRVSKLQIELNKIYSDRHEFELIKGFKRDGVIHDPFLKRQIEIIYNLYAGNQYDEELQREIINLSTKVEKEFSTFRAEVDNKRLTDNEIDEILDNSTDSTELRNVWESSKVIGEVVAADVIKLVKLRNEAAHRLGYSDYHRMSLALSEQNSDELERLFDHLDELTRNEFAGLKNQIDVVLSKKYGIEAGELMPWHYQDKFFQLGPKIYDTDLDKYFKEKDLVEVTRSFYKEIGLDIDDIINRSDLYEKEGKYQHAYCTVIDRDGDIRVVCNIKPNYRWMSTMLHEFGHAVYDKYISRQLPWQLREHAHIFTTEAIAMLFGRFASNPKWLHDVIGISNEERAAIEDDCINSLRLEQLVFSRWVQVMYRFEKEMYKNPDQDLNGLWWLLAEKYQLLKKPEGRDKPDWASKIHVSLYPAYYHNYMLGELLASQLYYYIVEKVLKEEGNEPNSFHKRKEIGDYLKNMFFSYGALYHWKDLILTATAEELNPEYYARQFV